MYKNVEKKHLKIAAVLFKFDLLETSTEKNQHLDYHRMSKTFPVQSGLTDL